MLYLMFDIQVLPLKQNVVSNLFKSCITVYISDIVAISVESLLRKSK